MALLKCKQSRASGKAIEDGDKDKHGEVNGKMQISSGIA